MDKIKSEELFARRIDKGLCPICGKKLDNSFKTINNKKYGKIWVCKHHHIEEE